MANNLDTIINKISYEIVEQIEGKGENKTKYKNEIDKALGVLTNDGVYAYFVYIKSRKIGDVFLEQLKPILKFIDKEERGQELNQEFFEKLSSDLDSLFLFREILEKILIYARYHARAKGDDNE